MVLAVDSPKGGGQEGKEQERETDDGALGTGLADGYRSGLEQGEGRSVFLNLSLSQLELGGYL